MAILWKKIKKARDLVEKKNFLKESRFFRSICKTVFPIQVIKSVKAGLKEPSQPLGLFSFVGSSGVGKTKTGLAVTDLLFGGECFMVTINMAEMQKIKFAYDTEVVNQIVSRCMEVETRARNIDYIMSGTIFLQMSGGILDRLSEEAMPSEARLGLAEDSSFKVDFGG